MRIEELCRWLYQKFLDYRAVHANTIPQMIRHILLGMVILNILFFLSALRRASFISQNQAIHSSSTWEYTTSDTSLFLSALSFIHVMGVWYFLFHSLEPLYLGGYDHPAWNHDSSSSSTSAAAYDARHRHQGLICRRNDLTIGIAVGLCVSMGVFLFHISLSLEHIREVSGPIRLYALFLAFMDIALALLMIKGKDDFIQTQHVWDTHQYQTISDTVLVVEEEEENRAVIDTILGYHHNPTS
jgi:hypothetical protein